MKNLPYECGRVIARALAAGVAVDAGNVIDLLADNLPASLADLRAALAASNYAGRWPVAEARGYSNRLGSAWHG